MAPGSRCFPVASTTRAAVASAVAVALLSSHPFGPFEPEGRVLPLADVRLVAPVLPSKIVAVAKNYLDHVREMGGDTAPPAPMVFLKPSTSVIGPGEPITLPWQSEHFAEDSPPSCETLPWKVSKKVSACSL